MTVTTMIALAFLALIKGAAVTLRIAAIGFLIYRTWRRMSVFRNLFFGTRTEEPLED